MDVVIHGQNIKITEPLQEYAKRKLGRLDHYLPNINEIRIDLSSQHTRRGEDLAIAQITVRHKRGAILRAEEKVQGDIHIAIDQAIDNMYRRIERFKGKSLDRKRGGERYKATFEELELAEDIPDFERYEEEDYSSSPDGELAAQDGAAVSRPIARRKQVILTPMSEAEAIEQMELLGHTFFVFFNAETGIINVLYKRSAGDYGLLMTEAE